MIRADGMLVIRLPTEQSVTPTLTGDGGMHFIFGDTVDFTRLTWEAFATFLTGALAVGGAIMIGLRQAAIQRRQVELQQLELRRLLLDLRLPVYEATKAWLSHIVQTGTIPNRVGDRGKFAGGSLGQEQEHERQRLLEQAFLEAIETSRFVFSPPVFDALERLWSSGNKLHLHRVRRLGPVEDREVHARREMELHAWLCDQRAQMGTIFGDELQVSDGGKSTFRPLARPEREA
jgi:hypothetical protein